MKILIVKPIVPYPPTQGTRRVTLNLIKALQGPHDVTVLCKTLSDEEEKLIDDLAAHCYKVVALRAPNTRSFFHRVFFKLYYCTRALLTLVPLRVQYDCPKAIVAAARALTQAEQYDIILVEYWTMAQSAVRARAGVKLLLEHDVDCIRNRERYLTAAGLIRRLSRYVAWKLEERGQLRAYPLFDAILALTAFDREHIEALSSRGAKEGGVAGPGRPVRVLPTGVDDAFFECAEASEMPSGESGDIHGGKLGKTSEVPGGGPVKVSEEPGSVLFVGSFAADFNVDAILHFVRNVFPRVRAAMPQARLYIAGGDAPPEVAALGHKESVTYLGLQEDLREALSSASVFAVPLRFAGGIRIRTLEAMAMGKAVVTTSVGIRGIEAVDGRDLLIADGDKEFAAAIVGLLKDPERRVQLGRSARRFVFSNYSMESARLGALKLLEELGMAGTRPVGPGRPGNS